MCGTQLKVKENLHSNPLVKKNFRNNYFSFHFKLEKEQDKNKQKKGNNKDQNKITEIENSKPRVKVNETVSWLFEKSNKVDQTL